ncbi:MAG: hypothetical protein HOA84_06080 [Candidatus Jacksonbacteria bacterium]|mgnify:CR=1 FL=1|jgi:hypothetical protein|nr:hypothetical protein [Candidatus Jacksonbacteria bacterium]
MSFLELVGIGLCVVCIASFIIAGRKMVKRKRLWFPEILLILIGVYSGATAWGFLGQSINFFIYDHLTPESQKVNKATQTDEEREKVAIESMRNASAELLKAVPDCVSLRLTYEPGIELIAKVEKENCSRITCVLSNKRDVAGPPRDIINETREKLIGLMQGDFAISGVKNDEGEVTYWHKDRLTEQLFEAYSEKTGKRSEKATRMLEQFGTFTFPVLSKKLEQGGKDTANAAQILGIIGAQAKPMIPKLREALELTKGDPDVEAAIKLISEKWTASKRPLNVPEIR